MPTLSQSFVSSGGTWVEMEGGSTLPPGMGEPPELSIVTQTTATIVVQAQASGVPAAGLPVALRYSSPAAVTEYATCIHKTTDVLGRVTFVPSDFTPAESNEPILVPGWEYGDTLSFYAGEYLPVIGTWYIPEITPARVNGRFLHVSPGKHTTSYNIEGSVATSTYTPYDLVEQGIGVFPQGLTVSFLTGFETLPALAPEWTATQAMLRLSSSPPKLFRIDNPTTPGTAAPPFPVEAEYMTPVSAPDPPGGYAYFSDLQVSLPMPAAISCSSGRNPNVFTPQDLSALTDVGRVYTGYSDVTYVGL